MILTPLQKPTVVTSVFLGHTPVEIEHNQAVVKKERGEEGSKMFTSNYTAATEALKPGFGATKHFV